MPPSSLPDPAKLNRAGILPRPTAQVEEDFAPAFTAWQADRTPKTLSSLLTTVNPVIDRAVKKFAPDGGVAARGQAKQIVIDALPGYNPQRGPLGPHLWSNLQRLQRRAATSRQIITLPEQVAMQKSHMDAAEQDLEDRLGRSPSDQELADEIGLSPKRIAYIRQAGVPVASSRFGDEAPTSLMQDNDGAKAWEDFVYGSLSGSDQLIMDHLSGRSGRAPITGVALAKRLGVSPSALSQRTSRIQKLLSSRDEYGLF